MKSKLSEQNVNSDNKQWIIYHIIATKTNVIHLWLNIDKIIKTLGNCDARIILACFIEKSIFMNRVIKCSILFKIVTRSTYSNRHQGKIVNANAMEMQLSNRSFHRYSHQLARIVIITRFQNSTIHLLTRLRIDSTSQVSQWLIH